jgi:LysR family transcriptional regulator, glycine cleavage system transcriptional activator
VARRLPPLASLRSFEAAARLLSFSGAARELFVTPTAVSHQIRSLEEWLGVKLFDRTTRSVRLTQVGRRYQPVVQAAFEQLESATQSIAAEATAEVVCVTTTTSFASKWLIPRLASFKALYPDIDVRISTQTESVDLAREGLDLGIRYGAGTWPGMVSERLQNARVFPVCSPDLLSGPVPLKTPSDLASHTLLHVSTMPDDWRVWLTAVGATGVDPVGGMTFELWLAALQAATDGLGVALGQDTLIQNDLAAGRLVAPFEIDVPADFAYYVVTPERAPRSPAAEHFRDWLLEQRQRG